VFVPLSVHCFLFRCNSCYCSTVASIKYKWTYTLAAERHRTGETAGLYTRAPTVALCDGSCVVVQRRLSSLFFFLSLMIYLSELFFLNAKLKQTCKGSAGATLTSKCYCGVRQWIGSATSRPRAVWYREWLNKFICVQQKRNSVNISNILKNSVPFRSVQF
jgi:hypothetical protein